MDYSKTMRGLIAEAKKGSQYARFTSGTKACMFIGLLPFIIESIALIIVYNIINFVCKLISAPVDYLNGFLKEERDGVKHLSQAIMYAIGFPMIFLFKISLSFLACVMYLLWFYIMCLSYVTTLGAIRWQPFLFDAKYDCKEEYTYTPSAETAKAWSIVQLILGIIYFVGLILVLIGPIRSYSYGYYYSIAHITVGQIFEFIYILITAICIPCIFRKKKGVTEEKAPKIKVKNIKNQQYLNNLSLDEITLPVGLSTIGDFAFYGCTNLKKIFFDGTCEEWNLIKKGVQWHYGAPAKYVSCSNGDVLL